MTENQNIFQALSDRLQQNILGQSRLVNRLLIALLADGHLLVEGVPGLAKTTAIKLLSEQIEGSFQRIQFTPDLLPADLTGTEIYRAELAQFEFRQGPIFHHLLLADEINRAPAKVQSALLEAMAERQVTVGQKTMPLPKLFLVMATQNPIEQEGTYPLPEAQLDRFLLYVTIHYPEPSVEKAILQLARERVRADSGQPSLLAKVKEPLLSQEVLFQARQEVLDLYLSPALEEYLVQLILAARDPTPYDAELGHYIRFGPSPRATIALDRCARSHAWLAGRDYVSPGDIQEVAADILRHRLLLTYQAEAKHLTSDDIIATLLSRVPVP